MFPRQIGITTNFASVDATGSVKLTGICLGPSGVGSGMSGLNTVMYVNGLDR